MTEPRERRPSARNIGVLLLAGGAATRLTAKLTLPFGETTLLERVFTNVSPGHETLVAAQGTFPANIDARLTAPIAIDRRPRGGPAAALASALPLLRAPFVFLAGGDMPFVTAATIDALAAAWQAGDDAVVPEVAALGGTRLQPLAALYDRLTLLRTCAAHVHEPNRAMHAVLAALRVRRLPCPDASAFANVNTPQDYAAALARLT